MPDPGASRPDQASGLRRIFGQRGLRVLPVATALPQRRSLAGLASAVAALGERVLILDHGWSAEASGAGRKADLAALLRGEAAFETAAPEIAPGVRRLAAGAGFEMMADAGVGVPDLFTALHGTGCPVDLVLLATVKPRALAASIEGEFMVLCGARPAGIASAYQMLKSIATRGPQVRLVFDGVERQTVADSAFRRIQATARRFLGVVPLPGGWLPRESSVAVHRVRPVDSQRRALEQVARSLPRWQMAEYPAIAGGAPQAGSGDAGPHRRTNSQEEPAGAWRVSDWQGAMSA